MTLVENYEDFKYTFHAFFCVFITIITIRMSLFLNLKLVDVDNTDKANLCIWRDKAITKAD